jgi:pimeloyl-ACP methyl ester carboxylesterase
MRRLLVLSLVLLFSGCVGSATEDSGAAFSPPGTAVRLETDGRMVQRDRIDFTDGPYSMHGIPFSNRAQKWHVYSFTAYPGAHVEAQLAVGDPGLADRTDVWLLGPKQGDGSYLVPAPVVSHGGAARLSIDASAYGQYAIVVGPADVTGFLPRYPGDQVRVRMPDGSEQVAQVSLDGTHAFLDVPATHYEIVAPLPGGGQNLDPTKGAVVLEVKGNSGAQARLPVVSWASASYFMPSQGDGLSDSYLGSLNGLASGVLALNPTSDPSSELRYRVVRSLGADGATTGVDPVLLRVAPDPFQGGPVTVHGDIATARVDGQDVLVPDEALLDIKPTFLDFDETSTYDLDVRCSGNCGRPAAPMPTRYPVYFAHGFNSTSHAWDDVLASLRQGDARWNTWATAGSVPGYEPVPPRAAQLRRNLKHFLAQFAPPDGESIMRVNIVAHSMGGLDSRYLVSAPEYNRDDCNQRTECTDDEGNAEPCCPSDPLGRAIPWRDRVASVTTLSTPHGGSAFADEGNRLLESSVIDIAFRLVAKKFFGFERDDQREELRQTIDALSQTYSETQMARFGVPIPSRNYSWACAIGKESCDMSAVGSADRPVGGSGTFRLPPPTDRPTFFSWAGESCISGTCGDMLDPGLLLPYGIVKQHEGANDGVVSIQSAHFGIFMGVRSNDHFHWNRIGAAGIVHHLTKLFGITQDPADHFHLYWLNELQRGGY